MKRIASPPETTATTSDSFSIPWPALSISLAILAVVSLGTLAVIVSVKEVDILSTVALALAILSFAAQLIVSILQTESSAKLNGSTESALAEMRATTESLLTNQREQFDVVLRAALSAVPAAVEDVAGTSENGELDEEYARATSAASEALQESLSTRLLQMLDRPTNVSISTSVGGGPDKPSDLDTFPDEQTGIAAVSKLNSVNPISIPVLIRIAERVRSGEKTSRPPRLRTRLTASGEPGPSYKELLNKGLITRTTGDGYSDYSLTAEGRSVARLLLPKAAKPEWLRKVMD